MRGEDNVHSSYEPGQTEKPYVTFETTARDTCMHRILGMAQNQ